MSVHCKDWCWSWNSNNLATWCKELIHWKRPWCWARLKTGREEDNRGRDSWMASPTWWTWVWASCGIGWWTGKPGVLQSLGSQRVRHNWATELNCTRSGEPLGGPASEFIISQDIVSLGKGILVFRWPHRNEYDLFVKWDRQGLKMWVIIINDMSDY